MAPFRLTRPVSYAWPVVITEPDNGQRIEFHLTVHYLYYKQSQIAKLLGTLESKSYAQAVKPLICGWDGVFDDKGEPVPFNMENLETLLDIPGAAEALFETWIASIRPAQEKN
jgi:hypothetical protein